MASRSSSGSERSPMAVEPTRSQKRTVTVFLTIVIAGSVRRGLADADHALERETGPRRDLRLESPPRSPAWSASISSGRTRDPIPGSSSASTSPPWSSLWHYRGLPAVLWVVPLENGLQSVGEGVGGTDPVG